MKIHFSDVSGELNWKPTSKSEQFFADLNPEQREYFLDQAKDLLNELTHVLSGALGIPQVMPLLFEKLSETMVVHFEKALALAEKMEKVRQKSKDN
jgi:hypothetical protein